MLLQVAAQNLVTGISIVADSLPAGGAQVGNAFVVTVNVVTEDGQQLSQEAAAAGLRLKLTPPNGNKAAIMTLSPTEEPLAGAPINAFGFCADQLTVSGG